MPLESHARGSVHSRSQLDSTLILGATGDGEIVIGLNPHGYGPRLQVDPLSRDNVVIIIHQGQRHDPSAVVLGIADVEGVGLRVCRGASGDGIGLGDIGAG